ncbi:MAG: CinA family nicotinamide mononucleotide deamidase-related protein [Pseudomonadales bacterium]
MKIEMICTGEEVLSGQIVDTNAAWFGEQLMHAGFEVQRRTTVGDRLDDLVEVFRERSECADIILVNGGLGPTADDLSAEAMAQAKGEPLVENHAWRTQLEAWFTERGRPLKPSNLKQAMLPQSAQMVDNPVGTACGFKVKLNRAWLFFTPGVPSEFKVMVKDQFLPFVLRSSKQREKVEVTKLLTLGIGESEMAERLEPLSWPAGITLGYRSYTPYVELKLIARGVDPALQHSAAQVAGEQLADCLVAQQHTTLASRVHELLMEKEGTLALAESLTGGALSSALVALPGSSAYLQQGIVSYCNAAKQSMLGVEDNVIEQHSEVSMQCVAQMARGAAEVLGSDYALATSGVAGPSGGTDTHPVGCVCIAVYRHGRIWAQQLQFAPRSRQYIRDLSVAVALDMLRRVLEDRSPIADYHYIERRDSLRLA